MLKGFKTFAFALVLAILGALETFNFTNYLTEENAGIVTSVIGGIVMILRYVTKTPMFTKD